MKFRFTRDMFALATDQSCEYAAAFANAALDEHLKGLERVYRLGDGSWRCYGFSNQFDKSALLFDVEELKPKECEHVALSRRHDGLMHCNDCGKNLEYRLVEV